MTLLARVVATLQRHDAAFALIGAAAMAAHGVGRSTLDIDVLTTDPRVLDETVWRQTAARADVRRGDAADPLAGVVRLTSADERPVDLIVGRFAWQVDIVRRARPAAVDDVLVPIADAVGLILLKLYAGGTQDAWDIAQLLGAATDRETLVAAVEAAVGQLPRLSRDLWQRLR